MTRKIQYETVVNAPQKAVWNAWTTVEGARKFFARDARIELRIGGLYELYFNPGEAPGRRGGEGCTVLSYLPREMLSFTWNAPPEYPAIRALGCSTWVVVQLDPLPEELTQVRLTHLGWGEGEDWEQVYAYFARAWDLVLKRLTERFQNGPIRWD